MVNLGLIGANNQGQEHLSASLLLENAKIIAVCDNNSELLANLNITHPHLQLFDDLKSFLKLDLDGIILALPHHVYEIIWEDLLKAKKPLLKEKPLGRNLKESLFFLRSCEENKIPLITALQRRSHPTYLYLKNLLSNTNILEFTAKLHLGFNPAERPSSWRGDFKKSGGGALVDSGYHMLDLAHFFLGPFNLIHSALWHNGKLANADMLETDAILTGKRASTWIRIESRFGGKPLPNNKFQKLEEVVILTDYGDIFQANREAVLKNGTLIFQCDRSWEKAMQEQLNNFAKIISQKSYEKLKIREQFSAMKLISKAYKLAEISAPFDGGFIHE